MAGKKYKFVITGHGKYEKIPVDDEDTGEFMNGKSGKIIDRKFLRRKGSKAFFLNVFQHLKMVPFFQLTIILKPQ